MTSVAGGEGGARFLVVEECALAAQSLVILIERYGHPAVARTARGARDLLARCAAWSGFFVGVALPDGSGLELLAHARGAHPNIPAMVIAGTAEEGAINATYDLGASYVVKPIVPSRIERFVLAATSFPSRIERLAVAWERRYGLSDAERDVLVRAALGASRYAIAEARGCSLLTVKKHGANLLQKTFDDSLHGAVERLLREAAGAGI